MNLYEFKKLEKMLGHPPTQEDVREYKAKTNPKYLFISNDIIFEIRLN